MGRFTPRESSLPSVNDPLDLLHRRPGRDADRAAARRLLEALRKSEELNRRVLTAVPAGVVLVAQGGTVLEANAEALRVLGVPADALRGAAVDDWDHRTFYEDGRECPV